jgi:2-polyprenyl-6-methoxyphenol hydroxylase-like FAD-dependent oxidoreductase
VRRVSFHYVDDVVEVPIKPRGGIDALYAPRRTVLDALLVDAATSSGATVVHGVRVVDVTRESGDRVTGVVVEHRPGVVRTVQAGMVVGADGVDSTVARLVHARVSRTGSHVGAVIYGYWAGLPIDGYHWLFREGASAGAVPTNDGLTCLFVAMPVERFMKDLRHNLPAAHDQVLAEVSPSMAGMVRGGVQATGLRGYAGRTGVLRESWGPGWSLVGDAGYYRDPITAHGITDALRDAERLAEAIAAGSDDALASYQRDRDEMVLTMFDATDEIASYAVPVERLRELHEVMSREMQRDAYTVGSWTLPSSSGPTDAAMPAPSTSWFRSSTRISGGSPVHS